MPELPEVETVMRLIRPGVEGKLVRGTEVLWERTIGEQGTSDFESALRGKRIVRAWRRAKWIVLDLEKRQVPAGQLLVHLRMTGRLHMVDSRSEPDPYERVRLKLEGGRALTFIDVRKFGRFLFVEDSEPIFSRLGPEPLEGEFTPDWFWAALRGRSRALKPLLLDQSFLAGLGNIYVDESLFRARLHPLRQSDKLRRPQADLLHAEIQQVLADAIEREGSSFDTFYRTPEGQPGSYQNQFQVYGRDGKPCRACGATLRKFTVGQRGTHVCLRCQRPPRG
ncbi:MAG: formamidopyrimidine-DNA glycosylase [Planctomycetota bacterium]|jgi:formamidopyrimidine-DNA glycosylase